MCLYYSCNTAWYRSSSVLIPQAVLGQFSQTELRYHPTRKHNYFQEGVCWVAGEGSPLLKSDEWEKHLAGPLRQYVKSPSLRFTNTCSPAHICPDATVGFGLSPGEGKCFQVMKGWHDKPSLRTIPSRQEGYRTPCGGPEGKEKKDR